MSCGGCSLLSNGQLFEIGLVLLREKLLKVVHNCVPRRDQIGFGWLTASLQLSIWVLVQNVVLVHLEEVRLYIGAC